MDGEDFLQAAKGFLPKSSGTRAGTVELRIPPTFSVFRSMKHCPHLKRVSRHTSTLQL